MISLAQSSNLWDVRNRCKVIKVRKAGQDMLAYSSLGLHKLDTGLLSSQVVRASYLRATPIIQVR